MQQELYIWGDQSEGNLTGCTFNKITMKKASVCLLKATAFLLFLPILPAQNPWDGLQQLAGTWNRSGSFDYETWTVESPAALVGEGYEQAPGAEKHITEYLRLERQDDGNIVYKALVPNQNNGAVVEFPLTFFSGNSWTFENPAHDFPQKIVYWLTDSLTLKVTLSGAGQEESVLWFSKVPEPGFREPASLNGYELFISSRNTGTVKRFNAFTGQYLGEFGKEQIGDATQDVAIGPDGMLYVTSLQATHILKFDPATGAFMGNFSSGYELNKPTKLSFGPDGYVYVSQWGEDQSPVVRFDAQTGVFDRVFTGNLASPLGHAWDEAGNLYVACFYSKDVRKFDKSGQFMGVVTPPDSLKGPSNLWFDGAGNLLVADWAEGRIKRFRPSGDGFIFDMLFAQGFARLEGVATGPDGYLYACDWHLNMVKKFDANTGDQIGVYLEGNGLLHPNALAFWKRE